MKTLNYTLLGSIALPFASALLLFAPTAHADIVTVTNLADGDSGSLRQAVSNSVSGDTIVFDSSLSGQSIVLTNGEIVLSNSITIDASGLTNGIQISGNNASRIFNVTSGATVTLKSLTLRDANGVGGGGGDGGALLNYGTTTLDRCTLTANSAGSGGAIRNAPSAVMTLTQCTLAGNYSSIYGGGGAIVNYSSLSLLQCTLTGNSNGGFGGGIYNETGGGVVTLINTIVAGNSSPDIFSYGVLTRSGMNIVQSTGDYGGSSGPAPITAVPLLAPLGNYGGPTQTMPPLPGSPAVDAGDDAAAAGLSTDQRGLPRLSGDHVDIGAVELQLVTASTPSQLTGFAKLGDGTFQLSFTNQTGASFRVLATTDLSLPGSNWTFIGFATESPPDSGLFQFTDAQAANNVQRFYRIRSP